MDVKTRNRAELKSYFVKNSIPTQSNFEELIDGLINQQEDGVVKLPGNPLSIAADRNDTGEKRVLNLYQNISDADPAWTLKLNPRTNLEDANSSRLGFSISDSSGNGRLFIDQETGNIGIGTMAPQAKFSIGGVSSGERGFEILGSVGNSHIPYINGSVYLTGNIATENVGDFIFRTYNGSNYTQRFVVNGKNGNVGIGTNNEPQGKLQIINANQDANGSTLILGPVSGTNLRFGYHADYSWVQSHGSKPLAINPVGNNVGIGTIAPTHRFHVVTRDAVGLFESTGTQAYLRLATKEGLNNRVEITNRPGGRFSVWTASGKDSFNVLKNGNVGIGTTTPSLLLDVRGGWIGSGDSSQTTGGWRLGRWPAFSPNQWVYLSRADRTAATQTTYQDLAVGALWAGGALRFGTADDLAEMTPVRSEDALEPGDVVVIDYPQDSPVTLGKSAEPYDHKVAGVVSDPEVAGLIIGGSHPTDVDRGDIKPIALAGRVLTKVTAENGPIRPGDPLTTAAIPGYAMKATRPGPILGKAMQPFDSSPTSETSEKIWVLVNLSWFGGTAA